MRAISRCHIKKVKKTHEINFNSIDLTQYIQTISISTCVHYKKMDTLFFLFSALNQRNPVCIRLQQQLSIPIENMLNAQ